MKNNTFDEIAKVFKNGELFYIFPHIVMDGDALGSGSALCHTLRKIGKKAYIVIEDSIAKNIRFLDREFCIDYKELADRYEKEKYIGICVDCSEVSRFPKRKDIFLNADTTVCIDHHKTANVFCDFNYIDANAGATAELIFGIIKTMGVELDKVTADSIFAGITTDTGNFQYSNTTKNTHKIACELYEIKDNFNDVSIKLYENESFNKLSLQSDIFASAELFADNRAIVALVTQKMLNDNNAQMDDSEGSVSKLRGIENIEVAILIRENEDGTAKASLRAKNEVDVAKICQKFGGGGHTKAAGFTMEGSPEYVKNIIIEEVSKSFE